MTQQPATAIDALLARKEDLEYAIYAAGELGNDSEQRAEHMASCYHATGDAYAEPFFSTPVTDEMRARVDAEVARDEAEIDEIEATLHALRMEAV
jgi:hypothetical protein